MRLRIIAGKLKGRVIELHGRCADFRPTAERVRESLAQMLERKVNGACVADICAGSGVCGFELLSRGAREVHFVESDRARARAIELAARSLGVSDCIQVWAMDARRFASRYHEKFDIIFFDPPYDDDSLATIIPLLRRILNPEGILIHERFHHRHTRPATENATVLPVKSRCYGTVAVDFYTAMDSSAEAETSPIV